MQNDQTDAMTGEAPAPEAPPHSPETDEHARLEAEHAEMRDRLLRTLAEMENLRKRTEREAADARAYAVTSFARDLLSVADNLERALAAAPQDTDNAELKALADGVSLTARELSSTLAKHGVAVVQPSPGDRFDPNLHQAMFEVPDPSLASGSVVQVVQPGYTISGRLLRPALVGVSKGAAKAEPSVDKSV